MSFPTEIPDSEPGLYRYRADAEQAGPAIFTAPGDVLGGGFGLFESAADPGRIGAVPHYHQGFSESFWVISGRLAVMSDSTWQVLGSGDFAHVPVNGVHAFQAVGDELARFLILFVPGAPREEYFRRLAECLERGASAAEIDAMALECDQVNLRDWPAFEDRLEL
ncbi:cupin domain-containing protein [Actinomycetospora endophytica]|uniref:Cupin domain-containing protein n=1 Tax=Actinomycetospora endophytica TaxID=2291215 RepID=A0ABS8PHQ8_9PSEU|nr:cupin domain-containing protein [Actinomycetospora endophytica]MCD2196524.1 cupin domain-containing protein [Actinomycetospora endophytica]